MEREPVEVDMFGNRERAVMPVDDSFTKALLHMDGADAGTTFTDESGKTWTAAGNAQIDTAQSQFGGASGLFDGSGDYISTTDSDDFYFSNEDLTIDAWLRINAFPSSGNLCIVFSQYIDSNNKYYYGLWNNGGVYTWRFVSTSAGVDQHILSFADSGLSTGVWYHIALVRSGDNWYLFRDGTQVGSTVSDSGSVPNLAANVNIGRLPPNSTHDFNGWIDEVRISKGIARWTANFTPPAQAYQAYGGSGFFAFMR